ncbi:phosphotransferase [Halotalea alkalilenta]|uniref:phosphotransferase n=1 Tax=Halotalea alkalilenta TaxID=376489 RepID=UPI0004833CF8|nr:phosphotransferase [Halotalea alkalilenta]
MTDHGGEVDPNLVLEAAGLPGAVLQPGPESVASPTCRAVDSLTYRLEHPTTHQPLFLKIMHAEMRSFYDLDAAIAGAKLASDLGIGPRVVWADAALGAVLFERLEAGWHTATLDRLQVPDILDQTLSRLARLHAAPPMAARFDPFARIDELSERAGALRLPLPDDFWWILRMVEAIGQATSAGPLAPCRNEGNASNLMISNAGAVMLLDFDRAGMNDPLYDVGVVLNEAHYFESEMRMAFSHYMGGEDPKAFNRARLYAIVDDVMCALWGLVAARTTTRKQIEFMKYGEWRLMRARLALNHPQFEEKLRGL